jgi:hypothetical protein
VSKLTTGTIPSSSTWASSIQVLVRHTALEGEYSLLMAGGREAVVVDHKAVEEVVNVST